MLLSTCNSMEEYLPSKQDVEGSSPSRYTIIYDENVLASLGS